MPVSSETAERMMREIAGLRLLHEDTAKHAALALNAIQESLAQMANLWARAAPIATEELPELPERQDWSPRV